MCNRKRRPIIVTSAAIIVVAAFSIWLARPRDMDLMHRARRIAVLRSDATYVSDKSSGIDPPELEWLSPEEAIFLSYSAKQDRFVFTKLNARTGELRAMVELNNKYSGDLDSRTIMIDAVAHMPPVFKLSPSRDRMLIAPEPYNHNYTDRSRSIYRIVDLNGTQLAHWKSDFISVIERYHLWLRDKRGFVVETHPNWDTTETAVFDEARPGRASQIVHEGAWSDDWTPGGVTSRNRLWGLERPAGDGLNWASASEWDMSAGSKPLPHRIDLPVNGDVQSVALSPKTDRVAWCITYDYVSPGLAWLHHLFHLAPIKAKSRVGIWVSSLHGINMTEIGHMNVSDIGPSVDVLTWLPDEKSLSFEISNVLYTVPVDR